METDLDVFPKTQDRWVYNKLEVALRQDLDAGVCGLKPSKKKARYIVRPVYNLLGMGLSTSIKYNDGGFQCKHGHFWCEFLEGVHYSIDYKYNPYTQSYEQIMDMSLIGVKAPNLIHFLLWRKTDHVKLFPDWISSHLVEEHSIINLEFIGDKVIEIHLRPNPDWQNIPKEVDTIFVAFKNKPIPDGFAFVENEDSYRKGFYYKPIQ